MLWAARSRSQYLPHLKEISRATEGYKRTIPFFSPSVGPANETNMVAPHPAAFFNPSSSPNSPWIMWIFGLAEMSDGILDGVRT